jgi:hypothetical protein
MESKELQALLEKYYKATTTLEDEQELKLYFEANKDNEDAKIFDFYTQERKIILNKKIEIPLNVVKLNWKIPAIAASLVIGMIVATFIMGKNKTIKNNELGTIEDPEEAYLEVVKALDLVSVEINKGVAQTKYINEFENTKNLIFKKQ